MTQDARQLMAEALKRVALSGGFCPCAVGAKIGLTKPQAEAAARTLANEGVLVLGFDLAAHFSPHFRKAQAAAEMKSKPKKADKSAAGRASSKSVKREVAVRA